MINYILLRESKLPQNKGKTLELFNYEKIIRVELNVQQNTPLFTNQCMTILDKENLVILLYF